MLNLASHSSAGLAPAPLGGAEVWELARELARAVDELEQRQAQACDLRLPLFRLLGLTVAAGPEGVVVSQAGQSLGLRPQALNRPAGELEAQGLLRREVDPADGRARRLRATPAGAARLEPGRRLEGDLLARIAQAIPQAAVARLVLQRLVEAATKA
jgi:DNA-binding MarR family transcriptional regulator